MKISRKIALSFIGLTALIFIVGGFGITYLLLNNQNSEHIAEKQDIVLAYDDVAFQTVRANAAIRGYMMFRESFMIENHYDIRESLHESIATLESFGEKGEEFNQFIDQLNAWETAIDNDILPLIENEAPADEIQEISNPILGEGSMNLVVFAKGMASEHYDIITTDFDELLNKNKTMILIMGIILGFSLIISLVLILTFGRSLSRSITQVIAKINEFATGNFHVKLNLQSKDEFGELSTSFNEMTNHLRSSMHDISDSSAQVAAMAEQFSASSEQVNSATVEITDSIVNISDGSEAQFERTNIVHDVAKEVAEEIDYIVENVTSMSEEVEAANSLSTDGLEEVTKVSNQMNVILANSTTITREINELNEQTNFIIESIGSIKEIAEQTNLLALNASIEAARAGESGQGFAVVANEVRNLAEASNETSIKIEEIVHSISEQIKETVQLIENNNDAVSEGQAQVEINGQTFEKITSSITNVKNSTDYTKQSVNKVVEHISRLAEEIDETHKIAETTSAESENIAATAEEQTAAMAEIAEASVELADLAVDLQELIKRYNY